MKAGKAPLLLDTQAWYWYGLNEPPAHCAANAWQRMVKAVNAGHAGVSEISFWEIALKANKGTLELDRDPREWLRGARRGTGVGVLQVDRKILVESALLKTEHRDPADRIIIATALRFGMTVATTDTKIIGSAKENPTLKVLNLRVNS